MPLAGRRLGVYDKSSGGYMIPALPARRVAPRTAENGKGEKGKDKAVPDCLRASPQELRQLPFAGVGLLAGEF